MDARIGYPNEHLASTDKFNNLTSPIYATGIGLVIKGLDKSAKVEKVKETSVKQHSKKRSSSFLEKIVNKSKEFFEAGDEE